MIAADLINHLVPLDADLAFLLEMGKAIHQDGFGAQLIATMNQCDMSADVGEVYRLLGGRIAATHYGHVLVPKEKAITGGACGDTASHELLFRGQAKVFGTGSGGNDEGIAGVNGLRAMQEERGLVELGPVDLVLNGLDAEMGDLFGEAFHQSRTLYRLGFSWPVFHGRGGGELPPHHDASDQQRLSVGPGGIKGGCITSWS